VSQVYCCPVQEGAGGVRQRPSTCTGPLGHCRPDLSWGRKVIPRVRLVKDVGSDRGPFSLLVVQEHVAGHVGIRLAGEVVLQRLDAMQHHLQVDRALRHGLAVGIRVLDLGLVLERDRHPASFLRRVASSCHRHSGRGNLRSRQSYHSEEPWASGGGARSARSLPARGWPFRPDGPGERSPGMRPKADSPGSRGPMPPRPDRPREGRREPVRSPGRNQDPARLRSAHGKRCPISPAPPVPPPPYRHCQLAEGFVARPKISAWRQNPWPSSWTATASVS
jgi:hypothetical protein